MRNVYQVLREKELELERVTREVEALRLVAPMLTDPADGSAKMSGHVVEASVSKEATALQIPAVRWP